MTIKFNPFRPNSIVAPGMFCGRFHEIQTIEQCLFQTKYDNPQHFLIEGERGIGKSSLMLFAEWIAKGEIKIQSPEKMNFMVISLEIKSSSGLLEFIQKIASNIKLEIGRIDKLKTNAKAVWEFLTNWEIMGVKYNRKKLELDPFTAIDELAQVLKDTTQAADDLLDGILVLIDEADKATTNTRLGEFIKLITERLTKLGCEKVCFGLAGLPDLVPKLRESHESSPRLFQILSLDVLTPPERIDVINKGMSSAKDKTGAETSVTEKAKELISSLSEGYPHFIQQFSYDAFEEDKDNNINDQDVLRGAFKENGALRQLGHKYFHKQYFDQISSPDYRRVLHCLAEHLDDWVARKNILKETDLVEHTLDNALKALKQRNIILVSEEQKGLYRLPNKSFAVWIKAMTRLDKPEDISPQA